MSTSTLERRGSQVGSQTYNAWSSNPDSGWGASDAGWDVPTQSSGDTWSNPTSAAELAAKPKLSDKLRGFRDRVGDTASRVRGSEIWRDAAPEVLQVFAVAGGAALNGAGITKNGKFSVMGTVGTAAKLASGVGRVDVLKGAVMGVASNPELQARAADLGNGLIDRVAESSDGAAAAVGFARKAAENPLVRQAVNMGARHLVGKANRAMQQRGSTARLNVAPSQPSRQHNPIDDW